jgi:hypothetical protein
MNKMYRFLMLALMAALLSTSLFAKVQKRMLMEDHTGAWCGWCVLGNQAMEDMLVQYGENFIPVALHNGDKLVSGSHQATLASKFSVTGYPSGTLNRSLVYGNTIPFHPSYWPQVCSQHAADQTIADVDVTYSITGTQLTAEVTCTLTEDYAGQLAFNLFVMADDLTGTGTGWDQVNYLTGRAGYESHPYYTLPNPVTGFYHMNVMIDMLGGTLGANALFPASPAKAGVKYTKTFTKDLSAYPLIQNIKKVYVIGLVQETGSASTILNAKMAGKTMPRPKAGLTATEDGVYLDGALNTKITKTITFQNTSKYDVVADFSINAAKTTTPADWKNSIDVTNASVKAGGSKVITLTTEIGSTVAYGDVTVKAVVQDGTDYDGLASGSTIGILSTGAEGVVFHFDDGAIKPILDVFDKLPTVKAKMAVIPFNSNTVAAYGSYDFKVIIVPETFSSRGTIINYAELLSYLASQRDNGKAILMTSMIDMFFAAGNYSSLAPNAATTAFFKTKWGISGPVQGNPYTIGNGTTGVLTPVPVVGVTGEMATGLSFNINEYNSATHPYYTFWADQITIVNPNLATAIMKYNDAALPEANKIAAVKIVTTKNKNIYMGFTFDLIANITSRTTLMANMLVWLTGASDVEEFDNLNTAKLTVYPNPVINRSTVSFNLTNDATASDVYLVDLNGNRVMDIATSAFAAGTNYVTVDASKLSSGKYFVVTNINNRLSQTPLVITK